MCSRRVYINSVLRWGSNAAREAEPHHAKILIWVLCINLLANGAANEKVNASFPYVINNIANC